MSVPAVNLGSDSTPLSVALPAPSRRSMSPRSSRTAGPSVVRTAPTMRASPEEMRQYNYPSPRHTLHGDSVSTYPEQFKPSDNELKSCNPCGQEACSSAVKSGGGCAPAVVSAPIGTAVVETGCYTHHLGSGWFWGFLIAAIVSIVIIWIMASGNWGKVTNGGNGGWLWGIVGIILLVLFAFAAYQAWLWGSHNQRIMIGLAYVLFLIVTIVLYAVFFSGTGSGDSKTLAAFWLSIVLIALLIWMLWLVWGHTFATWIVVLLLIFVVIQTIWLWSVYAN